MLRHSQSGTVTHQALNKGTCIIVVQNIIQLPNKIQVHVTLMQELWQIEERDQRILNSSSNYKILTYSSKLKGNVKGWLIEKITLASAYLL